MTTISVVIKARNEERRIAACIGSVRGWADEILLVDDGSTDATAAIAQAEGARILPARSRERMINELDYIGFEHATGSWILRMDADEHMTPTLADALRNAAEGGKVNGVRFARKNILFGAWVRWGGWFKNDQLRFFRADAWDRTWAWEDIHSQVPVPEPILTLPLKADFATIHDDYDSVRHFVLRSLDAYAYHEALVAHRRGRAPSAGRMLLRPCKRFLGRYLLRQGFRDGWRGLVVAMLLGMYDACIEAHLWDLHRQPRTPPAPCQQDSNRDHLQQEDFSKRDAP